MKYCEANLLSSILASCWYCLKIKRHLVHPVNHVILGHVVFTTEEREKGFHPIPELHIWCEYPFKNVQILLFVYIIEGAASDRGALGLCHWREKPWFGSRLFHRMETFFTQIIITQDKFSWACKHRVIRIRSRQTYYRISLDLSPPFPPFKVGESEWYGPPPTVQPNVFPLGRKRSEHEVRRLFDNGKMFWKTF